MSSNRHRVWESPVGEITVVVDPEGRLVGLYNEGQKHWPAPEMLGARDDSVGENVVSQLSEYFAGTRTEFDLELAPRGTAFQAEVWAALRGIGYGETMTYGELALAIGRPTASRAVGAATGRNPWSIIVPCHRLVGRDGALIGYAGGIEVKRRLLGMERGDDAPRDRRSRSVAPGRERSGSESTE
ncbi:methylated-DNA--[protein]-cysteine S-methyltransferase [Granulicoccus sp. GXG6511]|uniref:methylated-DNA--[protein]-cysteine S-methyltransferase n=1 Tax=Granulicoccus sp. GXG6511 TaxID=3381351 RepID=UPI003D7E4D7C